MPAAIRLKAVKAAAKRGQTVAQWLTEAVDHWTDQQASPAAGILLDQLRTAVATTPGRNSTSPLRHWMTENRVEFAQLMHDRPNWSPLAEQFAAGLIKLPSDLATSPTERQHVLINLRRTRERVRAATPSGVAR